jgi:hypothetical protein
MILSHASHHRRGSVVVIVLWAIAIAALITTSVQLFSHRQSTMARESLERVQARWAARAGIENTIEVMTEHTRKPREDDALAMVRDMWYVSKGQCINADYNIIHHVDGVDFGGPMDEHSKLNINRIEERALLMMFDDVTLDVLDAFADWVDEDNEISALGVERDYYRSLEGPYEPRNGPLQSLGEMELVAGIWPRHFRGEDWNLNGRLDPNENDGSASFPPDEPDSILDGAWSQHMTMYSVSGGATTSGQPRIYLKDATPQDVAERTGLDKDQAQALIDYGSNPQNVLSDLIFTPLGSAGTTNTPAASANANQNRSPQRQQAQQPQAPQQPAGPAALTDDQLRTVLAECMVEDPLDRKPGKININTVHSQFLRDMLAFLGYDEALADELLFLRDSQPTGIRSLLDLRNIPNITQEELQAITRRFDTVSNVYTISSKGRSSASGLEVEIIAVVDRSTVPVKILEYREQ